MAEMLWQSVHEYLLFKSIFVQFTLCHVLKGNKPDFHNAMKSANFNFDDNFCKCIISNNMHNVSKSHNKLISSYILE